MRYGYWLPVFGGWLRNVDDERMEASWKYNSRLARRSEEIGYDLTLVAELNLSDIKASRRLRSTPGNRRGTRRGYAAELMVAVRPTFHQPALLAKQAANIDHIGGGGGSRSTSSLPGGKMKRRSMACISSGTTIVTRTTEWLEIVDRMWRQDHFSFSGKHYAVDDVVMQPKPISRPRPVIYAGGESEAAKQMISRLCDAYVMHGDEPARVRDKIADMSARRERLNLPPMKYGVAAYTIVRSTESEAKQELARITNVKQSAAGYQNYQQWLAGTKLEQQVSLQDYSVSNRGLRSGLVGTPEQVANRIAEFEAAGVDLLLLQCSPQLEEMERFAETVIRPSAVATAAG